MVACLLLPVGGESFLLTNINALIKSMHCQPLSVWGSRGRALWRGSLEGVPRLPLRICTLGDRPAAPAPPWWLLLIKPRFVCKHLAPGWAPSPGFAEDVPLRRAVSEVDMGCPATPLPLTRSHCKVREGKGQQPAGEAPPQFNKFPFPRVP